MATVTANELSLEKTLEELITEFNTLRGDVSSVTLETLITAASSTVVFEGTTDDAYETTLAVVDPTADRTITFLMPLVQLLLLQTQMLQQPQQHLVILINS